ncbi:MAG TPA: NADH-quinone oxidoreductase subunit L [Bdellovibrionota bacterium]|nr:NADH-quinone oxidoreductase subunit L [Bdellovibrionota bacterium]
MRDASYIWLIPFFPLLTSAIIRFFGKRLLPRPAVHVLACGSVFASFILAVVGFFQLRGMPHSETEPFHLTNDIFTWIRVGTFEVHTRFLLDSLSSVMALVVTGVGFLIHVYSTGYMSHEKDFERYFSYLNLFMAMMLILVLGDSLLLMFVGWEGVGLCSYLLIGFWFGVSTNADAGKKAFIVNRIGDFGFILGILTLFWTLGLSRGIWSVDFSTLKANVDVFQTASIFGLSTVTFATLMLFVGATGKSAQIPLFVWLPDAMAGPTPVSALIHAATMVTAGVYMIARLSFLFDLAPFTLGVVASIGAGTALFAATIGLVQNDIKKVLAYSTVSQLGYMFLACGVGAYAAGIFHLMTHAFFKALLFLGAGSVIHAMSGEQDMSKMGGLRSHLPWTFRTFFVATLAIAGIPPFAGFFSKDEILWQAFSRPHGHWIFWLMGLAAAGMTAFYMFRLLFLTFYGECRASEEVKHHIHESPANMIIPLVILGGFSIVGGWLWWPGFMPLSEAFPRWLESSVVVRSHEGSRHGLEMTLALTSVLLALGGIFFARYVYRVRPGTADQIAQRFRTVYRTLWNKYWVDEIYQATVVRATLALCKFSAKFDLRVIDGAVNGCGWLLRMFVFIFGLFDKLVVDGLVNLTANVIGALGRRVRSLQTGQIQTYLGALAGVLVLLSMVWMSFLS